MEMVHLTGVLWPEGDVYVSKCPELGVASCSDTLEEAMANLREAVELYLENRRLHARGKDKPAEILVFREQ